MQSLTKTEHPASSTKDLYSLGEKMRPSWLHCISYSNGLASIHSFVTTKKAHDIKFVSRGQLLTHAAPDHPGTSQHQPASHQGL